MIPGTTPKARDGCVPPAGVLLVVKNGGLSYNSNKEETSQLLYGDCTVNVNGRDDDHHTNSIDPPARKTRQADR